MSSGTAGGVGVTSWTEGLYCASGSSSAPSTGGSGVVRVDGLESWIGGDTFFLNKEIIAGELRQHQLLGRMKQGHLG